MNTKYLIIGVLSILQISTIIILVIVDECKLQINWPAHSAVQKTAKKTQEMIAEYLNVTVGYISQLERGITKINLGTLDKIANYLGEDITLFITGVVPQQKNYLDEEIFQRLRELDSSQKSIVLDLIESLCKNQPNGYAAACNSSDNEEREKSFY